MSKVEDTISKAFGVVSGAEKEVKKAENKIEQSAGLVTGVITDLAQKLTGVISPFVKVQSAAVDLARAVGLAGKSIMSNSILLINQNRKMQLSRSYGISTEEMMKLQTGILTSLGRNVRIDQVGTATPENPNFDSEIENVVAASQVFGADTVAEIITGYDKLGVSMKTAAKATGKLYKEAGEYGINLQKYTENFTSNLQKAQTYNFRNGINGLKEMARKATEIRQDMSQIFNFADKVGSVTGAVETAANLQVLGGSFAALANPLTMLNKSLTDVEGLQGIATSMTEGAATYNSVTHEIEMDPVTRQIMKRAAESMGMDPAALIDQAYAQARRAEITSQMNGIGNLSDEFRKMAPNIGEIDEFGRAGITTANGEFKAFSDIATMTAKEQEKLQQELIEQNRSESEDIKVIAKSTMGIEKIVAGLVGQTENELARTAYMPGVISGKSSIDIAMETLTKAITESTIAGAAKLDATLNSFIQNWKSLTGSAMSAAIQPFSSSNPEEFGAKWEESLNNVFGDIFGEGVAGEFGKKFGTKLANIAESIGAKLEEYGLTSMKPFNSTEHEGREGGAPFTPEAATQSRNSVALAARDVSIEATNFSLNGGANARIQPVEGTEPSRAAAAVQGDNNPLYTFVQSLASTFGFNASAPVNPTNTNGQASPEIKASSTSIPGVTVAPNNNNTQTTAPEQQRGGEARQNGNNEQRNINITGTFTFVGDNGKIGTVDIMNNPAFMRELAKVLADTYAKMDKTGLVSN